jgi:hypothetical protein
MGNVINYKKSNYCENINYTLKFITNNEFKELTEIPTAHFQCHCVTFKEALEEIKEIEKERKKYGDNKSYEYIIFKIIKDE